MHWVNKVISYRVDDERGNTEGIKQMLIPVSATTYTVMQIMCWVWMGVGLLLCWSIARNFLQVLTDIARGNAFTIKNYKRLFYITNIVVLVPLANVILQVVLQWWYRSYYAGDLVMCIDWGSYFKYILVAVAVFLLALAFRKGYSIQQEQDLII